MTCKSMAIAYARIEAPVENGESQRLKGRNLAAVLGQAGGEAVVNQNGVFTVVGQTAREGIK